MGKGDADAAIEEAQTLLSDVHAGRRVGVSEERSEVDGSEDAVIFRCLRGTK